METILSKIVNDCQLLQWKNVRKHKSPGESNSNGYEMNLRTFGGKYVAKIGK